jgi:hypothetical protein
MAVYPGNQAPAPLWLSMLPYWATSTARPGTRRLVLARLWRTLRGRRS